MKLVLSAVRRSLFLAMFFGFSGHGAVAQDAPTLPGGAGSLTETHGDWMVSCAIRDVGGAPTKLCAVSQDQQDSKTGQRILRVELQPKEDHAEGVVVLPFGLALGDGVTAQVDDGEAGDARPFSTCLPAGCLLPLSFTAEELQSLFPGKQLKLTAQSFGAAEARNKVEFAASLKGFEAAFKRASELLK